MDFKSFLQIKKIPIKVKAVRDELLPTYATTGAAGADVKANITSDIIIPKGSHKLIPTGLFVEIPEGYEIQVRPRSGLALKHGVTVLNSPGTIDADYRGEIGVILINLGPHDFTVTPLLRIAQIVVSQVTVGEFLTADELAGTARGSGGFGHSGTH